MDETLTFHTQCFKNTLDKNVVTDLEFRYLILGLLFGVVIFKCSEF